MSTTVHNISITLNTNLPLESNFKEGQRIIGRVIHSSPSGVLLEVNGNRFSVAVEGLPPSVGWTAFIVKEVTPERVLLTPVIVPNEQSVADRIPLELFLRDDRISTGLLREKLPITAINYAKLDTLLNAFTSKSGFTPSPSTFAYLLAREWPLTPGTILTAWVATDQPMRNMLWNSLQPNLFKNVIIDPADTSEATLARILMQSKLNQFKLESSVGNGIDDESTQKTMLPDVEAKIPFSEKNDSNFPVVFLNSLTETGLVASDNEKFLALLIQMVKNVHLKNSPVTIDPNELTHIDLPVSEKEMILGWLTGMLEKSDVKVKSGLVTDILAGLIKNGAHSSSEKKLLDLLAHVIKGADMKSISQTSTKGSQESSGIIPSTGDEAKPPDSQLKTEVNDYTGKMAKGNSSDVSGESIFRKYFTKTETKNSTFDTQQLLNPQNVSAQLSEATRIQSGDEEMILRLLTQNAAVKNSNNLLGTNNSGNVIPLLIAGQDGMINESLLEWTVKNGKEESSAGISGAQWIRLTVPTRNLGEVRVLVKTGPGSTMIQFQVQSEAIKEQFNANLGQLRQLILGINPVVRVSLQQNQGFRDIGGDLDLCI